MREIGSTVHFGKRRGHIIGYTTVKRMSHVEKLQTLAVVELDPESSAYLEARTGYPEHDCFVSIMVINPENFE